MPDRQPPATGVAVPIRLPRALARARARWDRAALAGAQPHVTVLYPFVEAARLTPEVRATLAAIAREEAPFAARFVDVRRFEDELLWLEPEHPEPFRRLTAALTDRWPDHPPYGGLFDDPIVHLTLVESRDAPLEALEGLARATVPFEARAERLEVWRQDEAGRWRPHWRLRLGGVRR